MTGHEHLNQGHRDHGQAGQDVSHEDQGGNRHRWLMIACCIPMVVIVGVLLATGAAGTGAVAFAAICLGMMALMMFAMPGGHKH